MLKNKGISLIVLVITIIVIIILATAVILTLNQSGIINKAEEAAVLTEIGNIEDSASLIYMDMLTDKYTNGGKEPEFVDIINELIKRGYKIETVLSNGANVVDILLDKENISIGPNDISTINVTLKTDNSSDIYYAKIREKYYKLININGGIKVERTPSNIDNTETPEITASVTNGNTVTIGAINGNEIQINSLENKGETVITITYGSITKLCVVNVILKPTESSVPINTVATFKTNYGRIDVIWLDKNNNIISEPNKPNLYNNTMLPVTWTFDDSKQIWTEDETPKENWYNYTCATNTEDYLESMWANAKNVDGSYFVWIPRYAYRITYYENDTTDSPTGYYDGDGIWSAEDATVFYALDEGIEIVEYNGYKYIVHPAFETNLDNGGWDKDLSGIWVSKYTMSRSDATDTFDGVNDSWVSLPNLRASSSSGISIYDMYDYGMEYDNLKESHMIKNSEWGAICYLAYSKYGRNGHEIDINRTFISGDGSGMIPGATNTNKFSAYTAENGYDSKVGAKASTTGNVYGIYDCVGRRENLVAMYNSTSYLSNFDTSEKMFQDITNENGEFITTKYITKYSADYTIYDNYNTPEQLSNPYFLNVAGKIGDATKEIGRYRDIHNGDNRYSSWLDDSILFSTRATPFLIRNDGTLKITNGIFNAGYIGGKNKLFSRIVLAE